MKRKHGEQLKVEGFPDEFAIVLITTDLAAIHEKVNQTFLLFRFMVDLILQTSIYWDVAEVSAGRSERKLSLVSAFHIPHHQFFQDRFFT